MSQKKKAWAEDVFDSWGGYMAAKKAKLEDQFLEDAKAECEDTSSIFKGVSIFVNGYTDPTADVLRRLMMEHGGIYHHYMRPRQTTHMIASNLPYSKIVMYMKSKNPLPLCKPSWITDSIKSGKLLDFRKYLLYSQCTTTQPHLLNMFKSMKSNNDSKSSNTTFLHQNELKSPIVSNKNCTVSKSPAVPSTSRITLTPRNNSQNKFPTEKEFINHSKYSTPKVSSKDSSTIESPRLESPITKDPIPENSKILINSSSDKNNSTVSELPANIIKKATQVFPTEKEFLNDSKCSTPKVSFKDSLTIESPRLESPITKDPITENSKILINSSSEKNNSKVSELPASDPKKSTEVFDGNKVKESPTKNSKSSYSSNCSKNSNFISEFYNNSRLHHIATMGATFKDYINKLRDQSNGICPGLDRLIMENKFNRPGPSTKTDSDSEDDIFALDSTPNESQQENIIMHIDMDCFFVSVGIRNRPELKGLPVAVTHAKGNKPSTGTEEDRGSYSEIASCSYEARKFGLKNGMFLGQALKLCPNLKTIKYDFEGYKEVSYTLYDTIASYTHDIEAVSCDEMYVDCFEVLSKTGLTPLQFADILRNEIKEKTGCPVSTGFGGNKLQARLATRKAKPDGKFHLKEKDVLKYIGALDVKDLPGVGYSTAKRLNHFSQHLVGLSVKTCEELQKVTLFTLQQEFGKKTGQFLYNSCRGIDNSKLSVEHVRKSVSAEVNYGIRFENNADAEEFLKKLSVEVGSRLKKVNAKSRCITLKLMVRAKEAAKETAKFMGHGVCDYCTRSKNFTVPIDEVSIITKEILVLWNQMQQIPEDIRGIGIQMSRLEIPKNKTSTGGLMNFINKAKQINREEKSNQKKENAASNSESKEKKCNSGITNFTQLPKKSTNFQEGGNSAFPPNDRLILPSQDIDDSILNELPEDIRIEILDSKNKKCKTGEKKEHSQGTGKLFQTKQEFYFKEKKPNIPKGKAKLPPMREIDMAVLVELPEDIRNEILNEYKANQNSDASSSIKPAIESETCSKGENVAKSTKESNPNLNHLTDEKNFSFSQVDPEFLAALPEDMRDDVQMYCMMKKREKSNAEKKKVVSINKASGVSKKRSILKQSTNSKISKPKSKRGRKPKSVLGRNNEVVTRVKEVERDKNKFEIIKQVDREGMTRTNEEKKEIEQKEIMEILSHIRSFPVKNLKSEGQEKALSTLVKCMFGLSVEQVRMQIQNWISNSETVNEIDRLSLATYLSMLPGKRLIEDLHVLLKSMHRCITKSGSCVWHETYRKIVEHVQHYMQIEYNSDLMVPSIGCNLHKCKGDDVF